MKDQRDLGTMTFQQLALQVQDCHLIIAKEGYLEWFGWLGVQFEASVNLFPSSSWT